MTVHQKLPKKVIPSKAAASIISQHNKIYPRATTGYFTNWRWAMAWITQLFFYAMPWLQIGQRQALLFDIQSHRFYLLGLVLYPQDLIYLAVILIISALGLFLFTTVAGRLWCGFSCPQSVYTKIFLWIEYKVEGDRATRIKLDNQQLTFNNLYKKCLKHAIWIGLSCWTGFTFVGFFTPIRPLFEAMLNNNLGAWELFWILFYGLATYGNAGFLREQVCKHMCPYARFQSAMFDQDTLIVSYDEQRGEPRSGRSRSVDAKEKGLGDCIDCSLCVQVCPVGIDIRDGLQYECISCGLCVDACNSVMDKMQYPRNLIQFSTLNDNNKQQAKPTLAARLLRPRVLIYSGLLFAICIALIVSLSLRHAFMVDVTRDRGVMARMTNDGKIENVYQLEVSNTSEMPQTYRITALGLTGLTISSNNTVNVKATDERRIPMSLQMPDGIINSGSHPITFVVEALSNHERVTEHSVFFMPK
jgi:cytochrome c oxidase accessory protein FixG